MRPALNIHISAIVPLGGICRSNIKLDLTLPGVV